MPTFLRSALLWLVVALLPSLAVAQTAVRAPTAPSSAVQGGYAAAVLIAALVLWTLAVRHRGRIGT
jgi:hypothetical protein